MDMQLSTGQFLAVHNKWLPVVAEERDWAGSLADEECPRSQGAQRVGLADHQTLKGAVQDQPNQYFALARATGKEKNDRLSIQTFE